MFVETNSLRFNVFTIKFSSKIIVCPSKIGFVLVGILAPKRGSYFRRNYVRIEIFLMELYSTKYSVENTVLMTNYNSSRITPSNLTLFLIVTLGMKISN